LVRDAQGNLYGTTSKGGTDDKGTVFMVTPTGKETVLHSFAGGEDEGALPWAGLILDADGNLYGTTLAGGTFDNGTVFQLTPTGTVTVLYSFTGGEDGANPVTSLRRDADGNLYGTTMLGGMYGAGVVFKLAP
jgi:uncharacterized repeat protein (TIGR03803 family)